MDWEIRAMRAADLEAVSRIWLEGNLQAHGFVAEAYWRGAFGAVREALAQAAVTLAADARTGVVLGFVGMEGETAVAGLFVDAAARGQGVGKALLDALKAAKPRLSLQVYARNARALRFYLREGFAVRAEGVDPETGEADLTLVWERGAAPA